MAIRSQLSSSTDVSPSMSKPSNVQTVMTLLFAVAVIMVGFSSRRTLLPFEDRHVAVEGSAMQRFVRPSAQSTPRDGSRQVVVNGPNCSYTVDNTMTETVVPSGWPIDQCGSALTRPSTAFASDAPPDPMLVCSYWISALYAFAVTKYEPAQPSFPKAGDDDIIHHVWSDFGCFTSYRAPGAVVFGSGPDPLTTAEVLLIRSGKLLDVGSSSLVEGWRRHEMPLMGAQDVFQTRISLLPFATTARRILSESSLAWPEDAVWQSAGFVPVSGNVLLVSSRYTHQRLIGQVFQEFFTYAARLFTSGLLDMHDATIVVQRLVDEKDEKFRSWLYPLLGLTIVVLPRGAVVVAQRSFFVTPSGSEAVEPCQGLFVRYHLLPRVLARLRISPSFYLKYGDETTRQRGTASVFDWMATFPPRVAILKQGIHGRHNRSWTIDVQSVRLLQGEGYRWVSDDSPFEVRMALINAAEVVVTSFGALFAMMSRLYADGLPSRTRPIRFVVLVHPGYRDERRWAVTRRQRTWRQDGIDVVVTNCSALAPMGTWVKYVFSNRGGMLSETLNRDLISFVEEDCTYEEIGNSKTISSSPPDLNDRPFAAMRATWKHVPKYGFRCPLPSD